MKRLLIAAMTALPVIAMSAAAPAEDSKDPNKMTLHDWTGQLITTQLMGEALKKAGLNVEYVQADYLAQFAGLKTGDLDVAMEIWETTGRDAMDEATAVPMAMIVYDAFEATATRRVPAEYIVLASADGLADAVERKLREHGIGGERTSAAVRRSVEQFTIASIGREARRFQGHNTVSLDGALRSREIEVPAGSLIVRTNQPLGRLVFYLLEPESDDGLTTWNFFDDALKIGLHPVLKSLP